MRVYLKRFQIPAFFVALMLYLFCAHMAHAAPGDFVPLQAAHAGNWYDPAQPGAGFDVLPYSHDGADYGAFVTYYGGAVPNTGGIAVWFAAQAPWHGSGPTASALYLSARIFGDTLPSEATPTHVGHVVFTTDGTTCGHLTADVTFDPGTVFEGSQHFDLVPLVQPDEASCFVCHGVDFGPNDQRCQ